MHKKTLFLVLAGLLALFFTILLFSRNSSSTYKDYEPTYLPSQVAQSLPTRLPSCVPYPSEKVSYATSTVTPDMSKQSKVEPVFSPSVTPLPYRQINDLAHEIDQMNKGSVIIFRCDGSWDLYWFDPQKGYESNIKLDKGDMVWMINPPTSLMGKKPPEQPQDGKVDIHSPTPIVTLAPYPQP